MTRRCEFRGPRRSRGVAAVEFAITVPLLLLVALATAEVGRAYMHYDTLSYYVRNSARYVSINAINGDTGVIDVSGAAGAAKNLVVFGSTKQGAAKDACLPGFWPYKSGGEERGSVDVQVVDAERGLFEVSASYPYQPIVGGVLSALGMPSLGFPLQITINMRAIS